MPSPIKIENYGPSENLNTKIYIEWIGNGKHYNDDLFHLLNSSSDWIIK